jgi:hypothetical protein
MKKMMLAGLITATLAIMGAMTMRPTEAEACAADGCCKHCRNSQACGNSCIPYGRDCHQPPGCACGF